jgi:hypothetical protein
MDLLRRSSDAEFDPVALGIEMARVGALVGCKNPEISHLRVVIVSF